MTSKNVLVPKSIKKRTHTEKYNFSEQNAIFFFPNKIQKYGNFEIELERVNQQLKVYFATNMCKKGLFLPHTSVRNEVFKFLLHFPEVQSLVKIS